MANANAAPSAALKKTIGPTAVAAAALGTLLPLARYFGWEQAQDAAVVGFVAALWLCAATLVVSRRSEAISAEEAMCRLSEHHAANHVAVPVGR